MYDHQAEHVPSKNKQGVMKNKATDQPSELISRRTGIDRRWIPCVNHQPERRRGKDRRHIRKRSLTDPLAPDNATSPRTAFPKLEANRPISETTSPSIAPSSQAAWPPLQDRGLAFEKSGEEDISN